MEATGSSEFEMVLTCLVLDRRSEAPSSATVDPKGWGEELMEDGSLLREGQG